MIENDRTLRYLETVARARPVQRALFCPSCGCGDVCSGAVKLYACAGCGVEFAALADLKVVR